MTKIFYLYGMLGFLVVGVLSIAMKFWKKEFYKLIPFFIVAPTLIYLFDAQISADHPWLLRRFMITLLPAGIFYSGLLIGSWLENSHRGKHARNLKILAGALTVFLLAGNLPSFSKYVFFSEYKGLLEQTQKLGEKFNSNDLVLIDRETTGDGWSMISGPMNSIYGKNAAYFFNTEDLKKLDTEKFENIYLIAPNKQASYYLSSTIGNRLVEVDQYELTFPKISSQQNDPLKKIFLPEKIESQAHGKIFKITR